MGNSTAIAWTDHTFNPWMGCHKVSDGCKHCYAETWAKKRKGWDIWGAAGNRRRTSPAIWRNPHKWNLEASAAKRSAMVFCASLADVFEDVPGPNAWRPEVFEVIKACPWLDFQLLTKRPENIARMLPDDWGEDGYPNVWLGTSIEDSRVLHRTADLIANKAIVHFISYEPAIGPVDDIDLTDIEWLICGGESGPGFRPMDLEWAHTVRVKCAQWHTAFFFKQNAANRTEMGIDALGEIVRHYPPSWDRNTPWTTDAIPMAVRS